MKIKFFQFCLIRHTDGTTSPEKKSFNEIRNANNKSMADKRKNEKSLIDNVKSCKSQSRHTHDHLINLVFV